MAAGAAGATSGNGGGEEEVPDGVGDDGGGSGGGTTDDGDAGAGAAAGSGPSGGADAGGKGGAAGKEAPGGNGGSVGTGGIGGKSGVGGKSGIGGSGSGGKSGGGGKLGVGGSGGKPAGTPDCECFLTTPTCGAAALAEADKKDCQLTIPAGGKDDVLHCPNGKGGDVAVKAVCKSGCKVIGAGKADVCEIPDCPCFASAGYCGAGVLQEAEKRNCKAVIPTGGGNDVLHCPKGEEGDFVVKQTCKDGCVSAPSGQVDYCKATTTPATYKLPVGCGATAVCTNGNHTGSHDGKDEYAYDFGMPVGTSVRAMRGGTVLATRYVSAPGSSCYNGGGSACANYANTVEIKHSDGSVGLYMHVSKILVKKGEVVKQGDEVAKSGNSGWSTGPHTHVQVQAACGIWWCQSKPFKFGEGSVGSGTSRKSENCQ